MFYYKDQLPLSLSSGSGGDGCLGFHRIRKNPRGGPDGGDGGEGGSVICSISRQLSNFEHLKRVRKYSAGSGGSGGKQLKKGKRGKDIVLNLPLGTVVRNSKGQILKDFHEVGKEIFLKGGRGGRGNAFFKSSLNQAPRKIQRGEKGQTKSVTLELKPLIDVAVIGKVNAGKSSFFNSITRAKSPVADYPYTTLVPYSGQIKSFSFPCFIMDIPGLEKGASRSESKGLSFLRVIQRARLLLHFIDSVSDQALEDKQELEMELKVFDKKWSENYFEPLSKKRTFFILTKTDQVQSEGDLNNLIKKLKIKKNQRLFSLSNKTKKGLNDILSAIEREMQ